QMIPECVPGKVREDSMVLVPIVSIVREDQVWAKRLQPLEVLLDALALEREEAAPELFHDDLLPGDARQERSRAHARLSRAPALRAESHPLNVQVVVIADQFQQRSTAANFDVIGMRTKAQNVFDSLECEFKHNATVS